MTLAAAAAAAAAVAAVVVVVFAAALPLVWKGLLAPAGGPHSASSAKTEGISPLCLLFFLMLLLFAVVVVGVPTGGGMGVSGAAGGAGAVARKITSLGGGGTGGGTAMRDERQVVRFWVASRKMMPCDQTQTRATGNRKHTICAFDMVVMLW